MQPSSLDGSDLTYVAHNSIAAEDILNPSSHRSERRRVLCPSRAQRLLCYPRSQWLTPETGLAAL